PATSLSIPIAMCCSDPKRRQAGKRGEAFWAIKAIKGTKGTRVKRVTRETKESRAKKVKKVRTAIRENGAQRVTKETKENPARRERRNTLSYAGVPTLPRTAVRREIFTTIPTPKRSFTIP